MKTKVQIKIQKVPISPAMAIETVELINFKNSTVNSEPNLSTYTLKPESNPTFDTCPERSRRVQHQKSHNQSVILKPPTIYLQFIFMFYKLFNYCLLTYQLRNHYVIPTKPPRDSYEVPT